jgi:hypothetical protein
MKVIAEIVKGCMECPYLRYDPYADIEVTHFCTKLNAEVHSVSSTTFPKECPLQDYEDAVQEDIRGHLLSL